MSTSALILICVSPFLDGNCATCASCATPIAILTGSFQIRVQSVVTMRRSNLGLESPEPLHIMSLKSERMRAGHWAVGYDTRHCSPPIAGTQTLAVRNTLNGTVGGPIRLVSSIKCTRASSPHCNYTFARSADAYAFCNRLLLGVLRGIFIRLAGQM